MKKERGKMFVKGKRKEEKGKMFVDQSRFSFLASRFFLFFLFVFLCTSVQAKTYYASSPNGKLVIEITIEDTVMNYSVSYNNELIIHRGQLGYNVKNSTGPREWYLDERATPKMETINEKWKPIHGYKSEYPNVATLMSIPVRTYTGEKMTVQIRAANEGVAFRYIFSEGFGKAKEYVFDRELTTFPFAKDFSCYYTSTPQGAYEYRSMSTCPPMIPAIIVEVEKNKLYASITEAGTLDQFPPMTLAPMQRGILQAKLCKEVKVSGKITTPWRVVMIAEHPGKFLENAYLLQNLNEPCAIKDTSWIQIGKVTRNVSCQQSDSEKWVNYNIANNYQAILWDIGWQKNKKGVGSNTPTKSGSFLIQSDRIPTKSDKVLSKDDNIPTKVDINIDDYPELKASIQYAHKKGQKFFLSYNYLDLNKESLEKTFKTLHQWGIDGIKIVQVNLDNVNDLAWLYNIIKKAADYKLMVDIHDKYCPTGFERTYPNIVSIGGLASNNFQNLSNARPQSQVTMAFIRPINGMADFMPYFLGERVKSRAFQLACGLIFFNPLQHLHWYDNPLEPKQKTYPELEFWSEMPTTWDDTKVINGVLGKYIVIARRKGNKWYVSAITNEARTLNIPLKFLNDGLGEDFRQFNARIYCENSEKPLQCKIENRSVNAIYTLHAVMTDGGGYNVIFTPEEE